MNIPVEKIHVIENISQETVSLEQPVGDDDDKSTLENFIPDDKILRPDQESSRRILSDQIREVLNELNPYLKKGLIFGSFFPIPTPSRKIIKTEFKKILLLYYFLLKNFLLGNCNSK